MKKSIIPAAILLAMVMYTTHVQAQAHKQEPKKTTTKKKQVATKKELQPQVEQKAKIKPADVDYNNAVGLKIWYGLAITGKHFFNTDGAIEAIVNYRKYDFVGSQFNISAMYEYHAHIAEVSGLKWYAGGGGYMGYYHYDTYYIDTYNTSTTFGVTGVLGLEYKFNKAPIAISADWQPVFFLNRDSGFASDNGGLGVKYTF